MPIVEEGLSKSSSSMTTRSRRYARPASTSCWPAISTAASRLGARDGQEGRPRSVIQAGTATSTRLRAGEAQSFNLIHARHNDEVELQVVQWDGSAFHRTASHARFAYDGETWHSSPVPAEA